MTSLRRCLSAVALAIALSFTTAIPTNAWAFNGNWYSNSAIADHELDICFWGEFSTVNLNRTTLNDAARAVTAVYQGFTWSSHAHLCGGENNVTVQEQWGYPGCGGLNSPLMTTGSNVGQNVVIQVNMRCPWYWGNTATNVPDGQYSARLAFAHEIGHALGLAHSNPGTLMQASIVCGAGFGAQKIITADDRSGLYARYPGLTKSWLGTVPSISCQT